MTMKYSNILISVCSTTEVVWSSQCLLSLYSLQWRVLSIERIIPHPTHDQTTLYIVYILEECDLQLSYVATYIIQTQSGFPFCIIIIQSGFTPGLGAQRRPSRLLTFSFPRHLHSIAKSSDYQSLKQSSKTGIISNLFRFWKHYFVTVIAFWVCGHWFISDQGW